MGALLLLASSSTITTVRPSGVMIAPRHITSFSWAPGGGLATGVLSASRSGPGRVTSSSRTVLCDGHAQLFRLHVIQTPGALCCCFAATGIRGLVSCGAARARDWLWLLQMHSNSKTGHDFVVVASRLPVDRVEDADGITTWRTSPGGLVTALEPVMREAGGVWIGWS